MKPTERTILEETQERLQKVNVWLHDLESMLDPEDDTGLEELRAIRDHVDECAEGIDQLLDGAEEELEPEIGA